ncbi:hypothetical protein ASS64_09295 [Erythrobacter sp. AP23]|nr:hypothetical protein ASS64_09295 [Erythrobacter sp. AP23]
MGLSVSDQEAWKAFLGDILGMMEGVPDGDTTRMRMDGYAWRIAIEPGEEDDLVYTGYEVPDVASLRDIRERLRNIGVEVTDGSPELCAQRGVMGLFQCEDPSGLQIEVFYGPNVLTDIPFVSPAGIKEFVTGEQGLGHIFMESSDIDRLREFYVEGMGFEMSDIIHMPLDPSTPDVSVDLEFYHCNPRHHTIGLAPGGGNKRMHHFMLEVPTMDDVGFTIDRAERAGVPVPIPLGRHSNDLVTSFYMVSPSGFAVEFGYGGIVIDDNWKLARHTTPSMWGHRGLGGR